MNNILIISTEQTDLEFWRGIASKGSMGFQCETEPQKVKSYLTANQGSLVFWDPSCANAMAQIGDVLRDHSQPSHVFVITAEPVNRQPQLFAPPVFSHHIYRRYQDPASFIYSKLIRLAFATRNFGIEQYFPEKFERVSMKIEHSRDKTKVLAEIREFLDTHEVSSRISSLGVDAADELIMNALFDAPFEEGKGEYRRHASRDAAFDLTPKEHVQVEVGLCPEFIGIQIADNFGSLTRKSILKHLSKDYHAIDYQAPVDNPGAGLGLHKLNQLAMALLFVTDPKVRTEVTVLFGNAKSYREFRLGFSFFSIMDKDKTTS
jgi:hypothetical protein